MAITRVNSVSITNTTSGTTSATATIPGGTGILAGDLIIVCAGSQTGHTTNGISVKDAVNNTNYTTILETDLGGASTRWMQTFAFVTPLNIADGTVLTCTGYATATNTEFSVDVFRGATATISRAAVGSSNASSTSSAAPALASAPPAGDLALTFCMAGSGTLTPAAPFTKGSSGTTSASTAIGYVLSADGSSTYGSTWTLGTANTSAAQTVSFAAAAASTAVWLPSEPGHVRLQMRRPRPRRSPVVLDQQPVPPRQQRRTRFALLPIRGHRVTPVPIQAAIVPPPYVVATVHRTRQVLARLRGKTATPVPVQAAAPAKAPHPVRRARLLPLRPRGHQAAPAPAQIVVVPPPRAPQPLHRRLLAFVTRRGKVSNPQLVGVAAAECVPTTRPNTGTTLRPGSGTTAYATAMTSRPGTGTTARPNTGTTTEPC